jgi:hypothetical protein
MLIGMVRVDISGVSGDALYSSAGLGASIRLEVEQYTRRKDKDSSLSMDFKRMIRFLNLG